MLSRPKSLSCIGGARISSLFAAGGRKEKGKEGRGKKKGKGQKEGRKTPPGNKFLVTVFFSIGMRDVSCHECSAVYSSDDTV